MEEKQRRTIIYAGNLKFPNYNAAVQRTMANAKMMQKLGYRIIFVGCTPDEKKVKYEENDILYLNQKDNMFFKLQFYSSGIFLNKIIEQYKKDVCMVILYNYPSLPSISIIKKCRNFEIKVVSDITEWYDDVGILGLKCLDTQYRMKKILPSLDGVIAISRFLYEYYQPFTQCCQLPPLIDYDDEKWKSINRCIKDDNSPLTLIYAGSLGKNKDQLSTMIRIFTEATLDNPNKIVFRIVGLTKDEYQKNKTDVPKIIPSNIVFEGRKKHNELLQEIAEADFSFFLRDINLVTTAGFPTKFSESIACGTPVITNRTSDLEQYLIPGDTGFFLDQGCMTEQLREILKLPQNEVIRMKKKCEENREFDYRNYISEMQHFFVCLEKDCKEVESQK